jgi:hypothetical protein
MLTEGSSMAMKETSGLRDWIWKGEIVMRRAGWGRRGGVCGLVGMLRRRLGCEMLRGEGKKSSPLT